MKPATVFGITTASKGFTPLARLCRDTCPPNALPAQTACMSAVVVSRISGVGAQSGQVNPVVASRITAVCTYSGRRPSLSEAAVEA